MTTATLNSVQPSAVSSAVPGDLRRARPIRVATNAGSEACERLRDLGFAVRVLGAAALKAPWAADIDADIVLVDGGLTGTLSPLDVQNPTRRSPRRALLTGEQRWRREPLHETV